MKYILVILAFLSLNSLAFNPQDIAGAEVKAVVPCNEFACALVDNNGKQYILMGELTNDETLDVKAIYIIEDKQLRLIWSVSWRDT